MVWKDIEMMRQQQSHGDSSEEHALANIDFCYSDHEAYSRGKNFVMISGKRNETRWEEPKTYAEVLVDINKEFEDIGDPESFTTAIKKKKVQFMTPDKTEDTLVHFFQGQCQLEETYLKRDGEWQREGVPVSQTEKQDLDDKLIEKVWGDILNRRQRSESEGSGADTEPTTANIELQSGSDSTEEYAPADIVFRYRDLEQYNKGRNFKIVLGKKETTWDEPKAYKDVLEHIDKAFERCKKLGDFTKKMKKTSVQFTTQEQLPVEGKLVDFLHWQCRRKKVCHKVDGNWFEVRPDYFKQVHEDFQLLLKQLLKDEVRLKHPWPKNQFSQFRRKHFKSITDEESDEKLNGIWKEFDDLKLVQNDGTVNRSNLKKEREKLSPEFTSLVDTFIQNTELETYSEGQYNELYSVERNSWYVGDRIEPYNIEIFDIMKVDEDKKNIYLYHVKEGFGNTTRDACSQIKTSAEFIHAARTGNDDRDVLGKFYELVTDYSENENYRMKERRKLRRNFPSKDEFKNLFKDGRITYVYAFLDDHVDEAKIVEERDRQAGEPSKFRSNIARLELLELADTLQGLMFDFAICQIDRVDRRNQSVARQSPNTSKRSAPPPTSPPLQRKKPKITDYFSKR